MILVLAGLELTTSDITRRNNTSVSKPAFASNPFSRRPRAIETMQFATRTGLGTMVSENREEINVGFATSDSTSGLESGSNTGGKKEEAVTHPSLALM